MIHDFVTNRDKGSWEEFRMASASIIRDEAHRIIDELPDDASWEDLIDRIYVRQAIAAGLKESDEGRTIPVAEVRRRFGLPE